MAFDFSKVMEGGSELLSDPNVQKFMAQLGAGIDPEGAGGNIGKATQSMIERQQLADLLASGGTMKVGADGTTQVTGPKEGAGGQKSTGGTQSQTTQGQNQGSQTDLTSALAGESVEAPQGAGMDAAEEAFDLDSMVDKVIGEI